MAPPNVDAAPAAGKGARARKARKAKNVLRAVTLQVRVPGHDLAPVIARMQQGTGRTVEKLQEFVMDGSLVVGAEHLGAATLVGEGAFGYVYRCKFTSPAGVAPQSFVLDSQGNVAVKKLKVRVEDSEEAEPPGVSAAPSIGYRELRDFCHELLMLKSLSHPNVIGFIGCGIYKASDRTGASEAVGAGAEDRLAIVQEFAGWGSLKPLINSENSFLRPYRVADGLRWAHHVASGMAYLHDCNPIIVHRDLKPENILLATPAEDAAIKITDFGLSRLIDEATLMTTACGTPGYVAPEVITHEAYSTQIDMWSVGVIVYILLCGFPPFYGENDAQMFRKIRTANYKFLSPYWDNISADAKDFVAKLLMVDPNRRMTAQEALKHKWIMGSQVSTRNLFLEPVDEGGVDEAREGIAGASLEEDGQGGSGKGKGARPSTAGEHRGSVAAVDDSARARTEGGGRRTMQQIFREYNLDRKVSGQEQIMRVFKLPPDSRIIEKYQCGLENKPGRLYLTTYHLCFIAMAGHKYAVPLKDVRQLIKAKRFRFSPGHGHSIHAVTKDSETWQFTGIIHRDDALMTILKQCYAVGVQPEVLDIGNAPASGEPSAAASRRGSKTYDRAC